MSENGGDLDLRSLDDDELVKQMQDDLYDGLKAEVEEGVNILLERGWTPYRVLTEALVGGMTIVGIDFRDGILFVPEVLLAANAMKGGMAILRPLLAETGAPPSGKMVIGTVKGDIHDIGKNLVGMMMEGAGFEVIDLGINCDVDKYLKALEEHKPDILGMSALLTTTMPYMKVVIDTMKEKGIRDDYVVLVGGAPLNEAFAEAVGADAYCRDAAVAVETAKDYVARRHNQCAAACPPEPDGRGPHAADRLRRAGARDAGRDRGQRADAFDVDLHLGAAAQPARAHPRRRCAPRSASTARAIGRILVLYGDCGTGGELDRVLAEEGVERIAGPHCYAFYAGESGVRAPWPMPSPGTFYLTDFLARQFDTLVIEGLGLDRHPELLPMYFGNYRRLVYLAQTEDAELQAAAQAAAARLGLAYEYRFTGLGGLADFVRTAA